MGKIDFSKARELIETAEEQGYLLGPRTKLVFEAIIDAIELSPQALCVGPQPFDWKSVKPGMAFKCMSGGKYWYIGPRTKDSIVIAITDLVHQWWNGNLEWAHKKDLIRVPEKDIEVEV